MKKRLISLVCILALLLSVSGNTQLSVFAAEGERGDRFLAGFSRVDINPYIVDGDINSGLMELPLRGTGDVWNRLSTKGIVDDNGDGKVDEEDGLAVTCIAVTDGDGNTLLFLTIDLIGGGLIAKVRTEICSRLEALQEQGELNDVVLSEENIHYAGTHTHTAPDTTVYSASGKTGTNNEGKSLEEINRNLGIWIDRTIEDIGDAAMLALRDRAPATVTKDSLSASQATSSAVKGKVMNSVRHYVAEDKGCVAGDNFNNRGSNPKQITPVNDNMYLLKFDFPGGDKLPIILANWRGHPSLNNSDDYAKCSKNALSSDYPNSFRYTLEYGCTVNTNGSIVSNGVQDYRVAFFSGEGGNVNPRGREVEDGQIVGKWIDDLASARKESRGNVYGRILAAMAQECLNTSANRQTVRYGEIRSVQYVYNSVRRSTGITAIAYEAAVQYQKEAETKTMSHPWKYTNSSGEYFIIGSRFHAANIVSYWESRFQAPKNDLVDLELNAILLGPDAAFVTVPAEPFDYYYNEDGSNAWLNLVSDTYGTPFVLGYCDGAKGYVPNSRAYDYNLGSTKWMRGSYESSITPYAQGTGEHMIELFGMMLEGLVKGDSNERSAYCQHCKTQATWKAYNGIDTLTTGHYYLIEDTLAPQIKIGLGETVCFDLNGKTVKGATRAFFTSTNGGATLNLMDSSSGQTGQALGCGGTIGGASGFGGAAILVDKGNTLNFYSGSLGRYEKPYFMTQRGGTIRNNGTINMYGGMVLGGLSANFTGDYVTGNTSSKQVTKEGSGATVSNSGTFNMYGGRIEMGQHLQVTGVASVLPNGSYVYNETRTVLDSKLSCVHSTGKFRIGGTAVVDALCVEDTKGTLLVVDNQAMPFTGSVHVTFYGPVDEVTKIGTTTSEEKLIEGTVTVENGLGFVQSGTNLNFGTAGTGVYMTSSLGSGYYSSLQSAYEAYVMRNGTDGQILLLTDTADAVTVTKSVCIDLNGFWATGEIRVTEGAVLYGKDSRTDDYTVDDEYGYGAMTQVSGNVAGQDGYLKITEGNQISFHKVDLTIDTMSLRPGSIGLYYRAPFRGDEIVADRVVSFGICLSVESTSAAQSLTPGTYTTYTSFTPGADGNTTASTMVSGIMKTGNSASVNAANAGTKIYGCAYLQTDEEILFGDAVGMSLQEQVEAVDKQWRSLTERQKDFVLAMRFRYSSVMENWKIPNILS